MHAWKGLITIEMPRRRATVYVDKGMARFNSIDDGMHDCHVLGIYQCAEGEDVSPYALCELNSGQVIYAEPTHVRFTDTDENGEIIADDTKNAMEEDEECTQ